MEESINVLHVDDETSFLKLTESYLSIIAGEELRISSTSEPLNVFDDLKENSFDIIVTDYQMPRMDGLELLKKIRDQNNNIPIIIFTGKGREEVAINALNLGANYYIEKGGEAKSQFTELWHVIKQVVEHRRMEKALRESEERYRIIFDESPISLWEEDFSAVKEQFDLLRSQGVVDLRQYLNDNPYEVEKLSQLVEIVSVNNTTLKMYNAKDKEEFYTGLSTFFNEEAIVQFKEELIALFNGKTVYQSEFPGYKLTGEKIDVIVRLSVIPGYEETLSKIIVSVIDISKLKEVEKTLRLSEQRFRELADLLPQTVFEVDLNGKFTFINHFGMEVSGYSEEDFNKELTVFQMVSPEDKEETRRFFERIIRGEESGSLEYTARRKDGSTFPVLVYCNPITSEDNVTGIRGIVIDITQLKRAEDKLRRQKEELSEFAHFIAHDINNCLTTIEGYTQLLDLEYDETHIIIKQIEYMKNLLQRSLILADAGVAVDKNEYVNLDTLVERVAEVTIPKDIMFTHDNLPTVLCDKEKLAQVFKNIFENAIIHGQPQNIEIKLTKDDKNMIILINNDGIPIPTNIRVKIFDYGFTTLKGSMGLGLSIVRKIIEAHGWSITVQSYNETTSFQISIPFVLQDDDVAHFGTSS
ncbi:MAG: PAS domain S-box protein [Candidatus Hodarchaeota archaeon]